MRLQHQLEGLNGTVSCATLLDAYKATGRLDHVLLCEVWANKGLVKHEHTDIYVNLLERFDLICELTTAEDSANQACTLTSTHTSTCTAQRHRQQRHHHPCVFVWMCLCGCAFACLCLCVCFFYEWWQRVKATREYLVPAMLPVHARESMTVRTEHKARMCFFDENKQAALPSGVFYRVVTKCVRWSQMTCKAQFQGSFSLHEALWVACVALCVVHVCMCVCMCVECCGVDSLLFGLLFCEQCGRVTSTVWWLHCQQQGCVWQVAGEAELHPRAGHNCS